MKTNEFADSAGDRNERSVGRLPPNQRIARIEAAAREELAEKGYQNFSPIEVARRCGVSEATIYRYFPTKRDLLIKVAEDWFEELLAIEPAAGDNDDIAGRLRRLIHHSLWVIRSQPALSRFVMQELRPDPQYRTMRVFKLNRRFTSNITRVVEEAVASGKFRSGVSPLLVRDMIYGAVEHQTWSYLRGEGDFDIDAAADGIASLICHGMSTMPLSDAARLTPLVSKLRASANAMRDEIDALRVLVEPEHKI